MISSTQLPKLEPTRGIFSSLLSLELTESLNSKLNSLICRASCDAWGGTKRKEGQEYTLI
jgi:hypothetical protein